jgi:NADH-quinone oxidoreductase subunit M
MRPIRNDVGRLLERVERAKPAGDAHVTAGKPQAAEAHAGGETHGASAPEAGH